MTVKQLIAELQKHPEDVRVYLNDETGTFELENVTLDSSALIEVTYKMVTEKVMAIYDGREVLVEVPKELPVYTNTPGVVLS